MHSWDFMQEKNEQPDVLFLYVWVQNLVHTHTHTHAHSLATLWGPSEIIPKDS